MSPEVQGRVRAGLPESSWLNLPSGRRPKVYIGGAFRRLSDWGGPGSDRAYGAIADRAYIELLEAVESQFLAYGFTTCLPHRDEGQWGKVYYDPMAIGALCFRHVETSDVIFAIAEDGRGVHLELGFAAGLGRKPMLLGFKEGTTPSTLIWGMPGLASRWPGIGVAETTKVFEYGDTTDLTEQVNGILNLWFPDRLFLPVAEDGSRVVGLIDIGSHTVKFQAQLLRAGRQSEVLVKDQVSLGLIQDVESLGQISGQTMDAVMATLSRWHRQLDEYGVANVAVIGTAALRRASNANALAAQVEACFGWRLEILDASSELSYVYSAVRHEIDVPARLAVLNLGGGSIHVAVGKADAPDIAIKIDTGTRAMARQWPWDGPLTDASYRALVQHARSVVDRAMPSDLTVDALVHTGGELDFLLRCQVPMRTSLISPSHVSEVPIEDFRTFADAFRRWSLKDACAAFGLDPAWAVGAVASNVIALATAERLHAPVIVPSNLNVTDGIALGAGRAGAVAAHK